MSGRLLGEAVHLGEYAPGTKAWAVLRERRLGGSEISAVFGHSPWESPFSLWHRKRGNLTFDQSNDLTWWGHAMEQPIADRYAYLHPEVKVRRAGTFVHRERDYQLISPDRILHFPDRPWEPLEIKNAVRDDAWGEPGTDEVPLHYRMQCIWCLDCMGRAAMTLAVYFGAGDYREYRITYDETDALIMRKRGVEFLRTIDANELPSIDGHTATYQALRALHPDIDRDLDVILEDELAMAYIASIKGEQAAKAEKQLQTSRVADALGDGRAAWWADPDGKTDAAGNPELRALAIRMAKSTESTPYLKANPLPKKKQEIS